MAESFVETELGRLETELKSLHAQQPRLSASDEVHLLSILKAALGDDKDVFSDLVAPTLDAVACSSKLENKLDRFTSGLLLQLKMKFVILVKEAIISSNTQTPAEGPENEDIIIEAPTVAAAAASSEEGAAAEPPVYVDIEQLMPSATEQQLQQDAFVKSCHKHAKEQTESEFNLVLERSNVSTEKKVGFLERFRTLLERRLDKLLKKNDDKSKPQQEGATTRKRAHRLNREEREEELTNSLMKKLLIAEGRMDGKIKREMDRLLRKYEDLMKKFLAGCSGVPISSSSPGSSSRKPPRPPPVDPIPPPRTVSIIAIHLGWNHTHVGWIPPNKTTAELLLPPIPCLIGLRKDESVVLYGDQNYDALRETFTSLWESDDEQDGTGTVPSTWLNLKSMLADKEVEWRKGKAKVKSELLLAIFLIHVKNKIEAAIPLPSSTTNYKVMLVLPQVLSIVQRGRIFDATNLAGFEVDQLRFIKETTAAALAFAHDADICWSPGSVLPVVVCCPQDILRSSADDNNADVGIFSNEDGILSMEGSAGRQGLGQIGVLQEMTKIKEMIVPFESKLNKNSIFVHLDDGNYEEMPPCTQKEEMEEFRARFLQLHGRINRWSASGDLLDKIREHLTHSTVRLFPKL
jgi:hypothetical protein